MDIKKLLLFLGVSFGAIFAQESPETVSFCIVDMKFNDNKIKVLEFGEGGRSRFKGYDALNGYGSMWRYFWDHMAKYQVPLWLVGMPHEPELILEANIEKFLSMGGRLAPTITSMREKIIQEQGAYDYKNYKGIVLIKRGRPVLTVKKLKTEIPGMLFVGQMSNNFVNNKYRMSQLFITEDLKQYRPQCMTCSTQYDPELANTLITQMGCDIFVIKPINSSRGRGIIMVDKNSLDETLKIILGDREFLAKSGNEEYQYWATQKNDIFLVEEFAVSKTIIVDELPFDATMRLVFTFECSPDGKVTTTIYDGYWKLPSYPLTSDVSLTEKHKSDIRPGEISSVKIDSVDMQQASLLLQEMISKLYWQMALMRLFEDGR